MDKLRAMETFVRIVDGGSLTAAADSLSMSLPSVVRTLAALEAELDVRLLNRTTRRLSLTDEGRDYLERCRRVLAEIDEAEAALSARRVRPKGRLRITTPVMFGRLHVAPLVTEFLLKHPALQIELLLLDRVVDLVEEGVDAAVRIAHLPDSSLVAIPVGATRRVVCASSAYLKRCGTPKQPKDLESHRVVNFTALGAGNLWTFGGDRPAQQAITPALVTNQIEAGIDACLRGIGPAQLLCYQVQALLAAGKLKRLLQAYEPPALPIHIVYPQARLLSANVRAFVDWAVPRLRAGRFGE
jgi:DNA-binding transcriptional LysR family regulator